MGPFLKVVMLVPLFLLNPAKVQANTCDGVGSLSSGDAIFSSSSYGQTSLNSCYGLYTLQFNGEGALQVFDNTNQFVLWSNNVDGGTYAVMQSDGNLVVYNGIPGSGNNKALWSSKTSNPHGPSQYSLLLQYQDGNLVVYPLNQGAIWASNFASILNGGYYCVNTSNPSAGPFFNYVPYSANFNAQPANSGGTLSNISGSYQVTAGSSLLYGYNQQRPIPSVGTTNLISVGGSNTSGVGNPLDLFIVTFTAPDNSIQNRLLPEARCVAKSSSAVK